MFVLTLQQLMKLLDVVIVVCYIAVIERDFSFVRTNHQTFNKTNNQ